MQGKQGHWHVTGRHFLPGAVERVVARMRARVGLLGERDVVTLDVSSRSYGVEKHLWMLQAQLG